MEPAFQDIADIRHFSSILGHFSNFSKSFNVVKCHIFVSKNFWDIKYRRKTQILAQVCISYILFVDIDAKPPKGGNLGFSRIFEKSRILSFLRKSSICAMNVAYPPYERACVTLSDSRHRQALNFVDFRQNLVKIRKILIFRLFSKTLVDAFASTKIEKIFASTDSQTHSEHIS